MLAGIWKGECQKKKSKPFLDSHSPMSVQQPSPEVLLLPRAATDQTIRNRMFSNSLPFFQNSAVNYQATLRKYNP